MIPCPHCGETFREGRLSCPHCGADASTGWLSEQDQELAELDLNYTSLDDAEYDYFLESEGLAPRETPRPRERPHEVVTPPYQALILLAMLAAAATCLAMMKG